MSEALLHTDEIYDDIVFEAEAPYVEAPGEAVVEATTPDVDTAADIPEHLVLKRDWADTRKQHDEKQQDLLAAHAVQQAEIAKQREATEVRQEQRAIDVARKAEHNENLLAQAAQTAQRADEKATYLRKQQLQHGQGYMKIFETEMNAAAEQHLDEKFGPLNLTEQGYVDLEAVKKDSAERANSRNESNRLTREAANDFHKSFAQDTHEDVHDTDEANATVSNDILKDLDDVLRAGPKPVLGTEIEPYVPSTPEADGEVSGEQGVTGRIKRAFRKAKAMQQDFLAAGIVRAHKGREYFTDDEKGKKRTVVAVAAGALAIGATYLVAKNLGLDFNGGGTPKGVRPQDATEGLPQASPNAGRATEATKALADVVSVDKLKEGGTVWDSASSYLQSHGIDATNSNIDKFSDAIRAHNGLSEADARQLPVGYNVRIPREILDELLKQK